MQCIKRLIGQDNIMNKRKMLGAGLAIVISISLSSAVPAQQKPLKISGVYPHLATFNEAWNDEERTNGNGGENGIGAITPWADKLWMVTYSPHEPKGSADKLYSIDKNLVQTIHPESIGGTPANRMIHRESYQLITGNYFIDANGKIRVIPFSIMPGRMTANARHLTDPENMVYFYDMEGMLYEVNVYTLAVKKLFNKPVPGWHGKGAYTSQGRLVVANNGEEAVYKLSKDMLEAGDLPKNDEEKGVLASWDGQTWKIIERRQFTDVTGPGGIYGAPNDKSPLWSIGWDRRSVILKLLDDGQWYTYRLPKASLTYDHRGGWYTEWPRIRAVGNGKMLMDMHGMMYDFPQTFSRANSAGIKPVNSHLRYIPDFTYWNGQIVIATDETSILENPMAGRSQSNLWFGQWPDLLTWGNTAGWGGPWIGDQIQAKQPSDAFLVSGFARRTLHLAQKSSQAVDFTIQVDKIGDNKWTDYKTIEVGANGYQTFIFPKDFAGTWVRFITDAPCEATALLYQTGYQRHEKQDIMFAGLADIGEKGMVTHNLIRPAGHNKNLQVLNIDNDSAKYSEINEKLQTVSNPTDNTSQMQRLLAIEKSYTTDEASVIVKDKTGAFRLPKIDAYEKLSYRDRREIESERFMLNIQGSFYEAGRESGFKALRPIVTHKKQIMDFCTWRGLLVLSGTKQNAKPDGHYFADGDKSNGLWYGAIDDMWKLGKPTGEGGVWKNTAVKANQPSLPYIMTNYDKKQVKLSADKNVDIALEIDFDFTGFYKYKTLHVPAGKTITYTFPAGFNAHWVRAVANADCIATAWFVYD